MPLGIHKTFSCNLYLYIHHAYSLCFHEDIVDIEKSDGIGSFSFALNEF